MLAIAVREETNRPQLHQCFTHAKEGRVAKEMSAGPIGSLQTASFWRTITRGPGVFGIAVAVSLAGCTATRTSSGTSPQRSGASSSRSALDAALQPGDVSGLHRCALSGTVTNAIDALRTQGGTDQASRLETTWSDLKVGGAQEAAYVEYVSTDSDCGANPPSGKAVVNIVVKFDGEQHATAAYQSGGL